MEKNQKILLSGIKPTGVPHIGNYFGAMKQFVDLQNEYEESLFFIADYHALNTIQNAKEMRQNIFEIALDYLAIGLDPKEISVGTFDYPMLMAADILLYDADVVPVGQDQKQHIEIARDTAEKFNRIFGETFKLPKPLILEDVATVPGIDGQKMSKSYNNTIPLFAENDEIDRLATSIITDSKGVKEAKDAETDNVFALHKLFSGKELADIKKRYEKGDIGYKESKEILAKNIKKFIRPFREKRMELKKDKNAIINLLKENGEKIREMAEKKMKRVREKIGVNFD